MSSRHPRLSRRQWLKQLAALSAGGLLAACQVKSNVPDESLRTQILATPPSLAGASDAEAIDDTTLANFLALSAGLTGFGLPALSPTLGRIYLQSLQNNPDLSPNLPDLYAKAGLTADNEVPTLEALEAAGLFETEAMRKVSDKIIEYWYTGIYDTPDGEQAVATAVASLTWQSITYAPPNTICGPYTDFWERKPEIAPIPPANEAGFSS